MKSLAALGLAALTIASAEGLSHPRNVEDFQYFVVFGDSYTDDGRGAWYGSHGAQPPPAGTYPPESSHGSSGGLVWPQCVGNYTGATIYDYAISGATCSNEIISRLSESLNRSYPSVIDDQIPSFEGDKDTPLFEDVTAENSVYALWVGTNDLGIDAFLTDSEAPGTNLTSYIDCLWSTFDHIYSAGGRRFVILNNNILQLSPLYQIPENGGLGNSNYWTDKESYNMTEYNQKMLEYVVTTNRMIDYGVPFHLLVEDRWPGAQFAVYDVYGLMLDIYNNPEEYLESPYNVTGFYNDCPSGCPADRMLDSYLWYDALHPSNKTGESLFFIYCQESGFPAVRLEHGHFLANYLDTYVAKELVKVAAGTSKYGQYWNYE